MITVKPITNFQVYAALINTSGYFPQVTEQDLQTASCYGLYDSTDELLGGVLIIVQGVHAYLDYLVIEPTKQNVGHSVKLLDGVKLLLQEQGVKYVYACVSGSNTVASALIRRYPNAVGFPYFQVRVVLGDDTHG